MKSLQRWQAHSVERSIFGWRECAPSYQMRSRETKMNLRLSNEKEKSRWKRRWGRRGKLQPMSH